MIFLCILVKATNYLSDEENSNPYGTDKLAWCIEILCFIVESEICS